MLRILPPSLSLTGITTILFVIFHAMNIHFQYPLATTFSVVKLQKIIAEVLMTPHVMQIFLARVSPRISSPAGAWLIQWRFFLHLRGNDRSLLLQVFSKTYFVICSRSLTNSRTIF